MLNVPCSVLLHGQEPGDLRETDSYRVKNTDWDSKTAELNAFPEFPTESDVFGRTTKKKVMIVGCAGCN